jgi:hypothetical protein
MPDLAGSKSKNKVIWPKRMSLSLIRSREIVVCQKTKKWNCGGIHRITWRTLWVFQFFIRYYEEFAFYSCSIHVPILSYGHILSSLRFNGGGPSHTSPELRKATKDRRGLKHLGRSKFDLKCCLDTQI